MNTVLAQPKVKPAPVKPSLTPAQGVTLQRKCACGGSAAMSGDCKECQEKWLTINRYSTDRQSPSGFLPSPSKLAGSTPATDTGGGARFGAGHDFGRLRVGAINLGGPSNDRAVSQPGDRSEQEADRAADQVMRALSSPVFEEKKEASALSQSPSLIQREIADGSAAETEAGAIAEETPAAGLIVNDDAQAAIGPGQMRKSEFLNELRAAVCAAADAELAAAGRSTEGCPYIERAFERYRAMSASQLESRLRRYAPEAAGGTSARDYIPAVSDRVRRAVALWAATGQVTGVPEELASELPGAGLLGAFGGLLSGIGGVVSSLVGGIGGIFFKARDGSAKDADPREVSAQLGSGNSLDGGVKSRMESAFDHDFSRVRVHTDGGAARLAANLSARAFTIGSDIAFGAGEYQPGTLIGDALLAHELAHVVQQGGATTSNEPMQKSQASYGALEDDADNAAVGAVISLWGGAKGKLGEISRYATPRMKSGLRLQRCKGPTAAKEPPKSAPTGCDASFAGVSFALSDQVASGVSPAVTFLLGAVGGHDGLAMRGIAPAAYSPKITITAPSDDKAKEFEVGIIQNLLSERLEYTYTAGGPLHSTLPTPIKDGAPRSSGIYDEVFAENGGGGPGILESFSANGSTLNLNLPDTPSDFAFINLGDNPECVGSGQAGTMTNALFNDAFRTWVGVRHKQSGCVRTIHHINWNTDWSASVDGAATPPTFTVISEAIVVTESNGDGSPRFIQGGDVPADLLDANRRCGP
jgi:hypothetical protein